MYYQISYPFHEIVKSLLDISLEVGIILSDFEQLHKALNTLNVLSVCLFIVKLIVVFVRFDHLIMRCLHYLVDLLPFLFYFLGLLLLCLKLFG
jgi:hypothetical protein